MCKKRCECGTKLRSGNKVGICSLCLKRSERCEWCGEKATKFMGTDIYLCDDHLKSARSMEAKQTNWVGPGRKWYHGLEDF